MKLRNNIFWAHLVVGIIVGVVVLMMSVTGALLAFRPQILDFTEAKVNRVAFNGQQPLDYKTLADKIRQSYPDAKIRNILVTLDPQKAVMANLGGDGIIFINPYTGDILGHGSQTREFLEEVESWHRWLAMKGDLKVIGHTIKEACNVAFFFMICTGVYLWWPRKTLKFLSQARGKARDWNWHNVIGFWFAPFLIIITLTGIVMSYSWANNLVYRITGNEPPAAMQEKGKSKGNTLNIMIEENGPMVRSQLTIDSATGEIIKSQSYAEQNTGRKLRTFIRYLHTGEAVGFIGQIFAFFACLAAVLLIWTGFAMSWNRFFKIKRT